MTAHEPAHHMETLRADMLQRELHRAHASLARVLQLADAWDDEFGQDKINTDVVTAVLRGAVRGMQAT